MQHGKFRQFTAGIAAVVLAAALAVTAAPAAAAVGVCGPFPDVKPGDAHCANIGWLAATGVTAGFTDGTYRPGVAVNRGSMATFLYRLTHPGQPVPACTKKPFKDVPVGFVHCGAIQWAVTSGVTVGYSDGTYRPDTAVNRGSMATFMHRIARPGKPAPACTKKPFKDVATNFVHCGPIQWAVNDGITVGYRDGTFRPDTAVNRGSMATFMHRLSDRIGHTVPQEPVVTYRTWTQDSVIPIPDPVRVNDPGIPAGVEQPWTDGAVGWLRTTYRQKLVDGVETGSPAQISTQVITQPVAPVIHVGTATGDAVWVYHADIALEIARLVNEYRVSQLGEENALSPIAEDETINPGGGQFGEQHTAALHAYGYFGANADSSVHETARAVVDALIASPEHMGTMLTKRAPYGVTCSYWTESIAYELGAPVSLCRM